MPSSRSGKWAVSLAAGFVLGYIFTFFGAQYLYKIMAMMQVYIGILIGVIGASSGVVSIISLFKDRERSPFVFISLGLGLYGIAFLSFLVWLTFFGGSLFSIGGGF